MEELPAYDPRVSSGRAERCEYCDEWEGCAERRTGVPPSAACFVPRRRLDLARVRSLLLRLRHAAGLPAAPFATLERVLRTHFARAMARYSNILEFSFSACGTEVSPYRFSYSFPAFGGAAAARELATCRALVGPFGPGALRVADRVLAQADPALVTQPLFGIDARPGVLRLKLYLQFPDGRARDKLALLARLLPAAALRRFADAPERLHLVGIDFGREGVLGFKLYYLRMGVAAAVLGRAFPRAAVLRHLEERRRVETFDDVVLIGRFSPAGESWGPPIAELDLGLRANRLGWSDVDGFYARRATGRSFAAFRRGLLAGRRWAATRLSVSAVGGGKLNVYYVPLDPPRKGRE